ncbi:DNA-binding response regulator [Amphritea opalescens]|uniref:DNA-binding response regulator n=1 Tax=Amphritea opalescens TaxID=2490544 RepID=A0A430KQ57_9GAMM|nr:response regulator transcription factor [Amphritea opalescens]RTE65600.1 DNA-binding response regulator [Amphritea opalescens]
MSERVTIVAADDHSMFLEGLSSLIGKSSTFQLLGTGANGDELIALIEQFSPTIALVDLSMPGAKTADILKYVETHSPETQLIALTMHLEAHLAKTLLRLGLSGYVLKESAFEELSDAINNVVAGEQFLSPAMMEALSVVDADEAALTLREVEVLACASNGLSNKETGRQLDISERTVRFHISNSCLKLNAHGRANAVAVALKNGYIS